MEDLVGKLFVLGSIVVVIVATIVVAAMLVLKQANPSQPYLLMKIISAGEEGGGLHSHLLGFDKKTHLTRDVGEEMQRRVMEWRVMFRHYILTVEHCLAALHALCA